MGRAKGVAAVAHLVQMRQKQESILDKVSKMRLKVIPSGYKNVKTGHAILEVHPDFFRRMVEDGILAESKERNQPVSRLDKFTDLLAKGITTGISLSHSALKMYGFLNEVRSKDAKGAAKVLTQKFTYEGKLDENNLKKDIDDSVNRINDCLERIHANLVDKSSVNPLAYKSRVNPQAASKPKLLKWALSIWQAGRD